MKDCFIKVAAAVCNVILNGLCRCDSQKVWLWLPDMLEEFGDIFRGQNLVTNSVHSTSMRPADQMIGSLIFEIGFLFAVWS